MADELTPLKIVKTRRLASLTPQYVRFCQLIAQGKNGQEAYLEAVAKDKNKTLPETAGRAAQRLLKRHDVRQYLRALQDHSFHVAQLTNDRLVMGLSAVATGDRTLMFADDGTIIPPRQWPAELKLAVESIKVIEKVGNYLDPETNEMKRGVIERRFEIRTASRNAAYELLLKLRKMIGDGSDGDGAAGGPGGKRDHTINVYGDPRVKLDDEDESPALLTDGAAHA